MSACLAACALASFLWFHDLVYIFCLDFLDFCFYLACGLAGSFFVPRFIFLLAGYPAFIDTVAEAVFLSFRFAMIFVFTVVPGICFLLVDLYIFFKVMFLLKVLLFVFFGMYIFVFRFFPQIPRILNPVAEAVRSLEEMSLDPVLGRYVEDGWGGVENAKMAILSDFFKVMDECTGLICKMSCALLLVMRDLSLCGSFQSIG